MSLPWETAQKENRRELVLRGASSSKLLKDSGGDLPELIWQLQQLNFLEASSIGIERISHDISKLNLLTRLCLRDNKLENLPTEMNCLQKLTQLDVSGNKIQIIDKSMIDSWKSLSNMNLSGNELVTLPSFEALINLQYVNVASNKLQALPDGLSNAPNILVVEAQCNELTVLSDEVTQLPHLKQLFVYTNKLTEMPPALHKCSKLKDLKAGGNLFTDKRLRKMTEDSKTSSSAIMEYLRKQYGASGKGKGKGKGKGRTRTSSSRCSADDAEGDVEEEVGNKRVIEIRRPGDDAVVVEVSPTALNLRPYLVCVVVRGIQLTEDRCRAFIKFQESLHSSICKNRQAAAIGAHDWKFLTLPLKFLAADARDIRITPLGGKETTAYAYLRELRMSAEIERKRLKRDKVSGVHKYLWMVDVSGELVHLKGGDDLVLSIHPLTNCEQSRLNADTQNILIEVSGADKLDVCKTVMDQLIVWLAEKCTEENGVLIVEQAKVINAEAGTLRVLYPSVNDLQKVGDGLLVRRPR